MAEKSKKKMTRAQLLKDAELETDLPPKYSDSKPGSTERPIPRTARRDFIRDFVPEGAGPVPKKYLDYADQEAREAAAGERRETRGMKKGGSVNENKAMKKMGRGLTKAAMQKVASKVVKGHEKRMHGKYEVGGSVKMSSASKRADGCAVRGKTRGMMV